MITVLPIPGPGTHLLKCPDTWDGDKQGDTRVRVSEGGRAQLPSSQDYQRQGLRGRIPTIKHLSSLAYYHP